ncbi:MAG: DUF11 domain-containing protein, partial [Gammaproteobacteria bacterium]|nr:DUF11 domain-containing protein [Gammaproteobacteria bacterium]
MRKGKDLHISFEKEGQDVDLIIEGFYNYENQALIGAHENNKYYYYIPDTAEVEDYVTQLVDGDIEGHALGGEETTPWWSLAIVEVGGILPWLVAVGLLGTAIGLAMRGKSENDVPEAVNDRYTLENYTDSYTGNVSENDYRSKDGDFFCIKKDNQPRHGTVTLDSATGEFIYTPDETFQGEDSFVYTITDSNCDRSQATVILNVKDTSKPSTCVPIADIEDDFSLDNEYGTAVTVDLVKNDQKDGDKIDLSSIKLLDKNGNKVTTLKVLGEGTWTINSDGTATFTPEEGFVGNPTPVDYTAKTITGKEVDAPATVTITYTDKPVEPQANPRIELLKGSEMPANAKVGDEITYTFTAKNTGDVTVENVKITDKKLGLIGDKALDAGVLKPDESIQITVKYTLTQEDFDTGKVENTAMVIGTDPNGNKVTDDSDSTNQADEDSQKTGNPNNTDDEKGNDGDPNNDPTVTPLAPKGELALIKAGVYADVNQDKMANVGDTITYTLTAENTGNVTLKNVTISDEKLKLINAKPTHIIDDKGNETAVTTATVTLKPHEKAIIKDVVYTITQDDVDKGKVENTAIAKGTDPKGTEITDDSDSKNPADEDSQKTGNPNNTDDEKGNDGDPNNDPTVTPLAPKGELALIKAGVYADVNQDKMANVGDTITYTLTAENTGNVTLKNVTISDEKLKLINAKPTITYT